jgi:hypothetical protein
MRTSTKECGWPPCHLKTYTIKITAYHDDGSINDRLNFCSLLHLANWCIGYGRYEIRMDVDCTEKEMASIDKEMEKMMDRTQADRE